MPGIASSPSGTVRLRVSHSVSIIDVARALYRLMEGVFVVVGYRKIILLTTGDTSVLPKL